MMNAGHSIWVGVGAALLTSLAIGALNGVLIAYVRMPPFVITLGMLAIARSLAMVASNNRMVYDFGPDQAKLLALGDMTGKMNYLSGSHIEIWVQQTASHDNFATPVEYAYQFVVESQ